MSLLAVRGATVRFEGATALDAVDLDVASREVVAVLGPSGSGKSTLLRAIAGLQPLDTGSVHLAGRDLAGVPPHARGVGLMFQDHALFPHRDVAGNVGFGLRMQGRPRHQIASRVDELLELVGLPGFGRRAIHTLSGGEQQRVALARALAPQPRLLLLDEPLGALDRVLRDRLVGELRELFTALELTVVTVTHDQAEAFALADRLVVMDAGAIVQVGTPAAVWSRPADPGVAGLLGLANVVHVEVAAGIALTPWGPMAVPAADGATTVLVRASGLVLDTDGPIEGRVVSRTFQGARTLVRLAAEGAPPLEVEIPSAQELAIGDVVRVRSEPGAVVVIGR